MELPHRNQEFTETLFSRLRTLCQKFFGMNRTSPGCTVTSQLLLSASWYNGYTAVSGL